MEKVRIEDVDSWVGPQSAKRPVSRALDAEHLAVNYFELEPGERFGFGYHRHPEQEEMFYIMDGTATFETEEDDVVVEAGQLVRFEPGEWQLGENLGEETVRALAMGAPASENQTDLRRHCEECGGREPTSIERADDGPGIVTICESCGAETGRFEP